MIGRGKEKKSQETIVIETVKDIVITVMLASILLYGEWISGIKRGKTTGNFAKKNKKQKKTVCNKKLFAKNPPFLWNISEKE